MRAEAPVRSRNTSIWQSAKRATVLERREGKLDLLTEDEAKSLPKNMTAAAAPPTAAMAPRTPNTALGKLKDLVASYSTLDLVGWAKCVWEYAKYSFWARFPKYVDWSKQSPASLSFGVIDYKLPSTCKILMIGDWGTRMTDNVAMLRQGLKKFQPDAIIHLGDVYYSGTEKECTENVIDVMDALVKELKIKRPPFFTIPGNHEYYSGGHGFYDMISKLNSGLPGCEQKASYFCLRTQDDRWQFLAMDTGYNDRVPGKGVAPPLQPTEVNWHRDKLDNFVGTTVLLSHHQLFSANSQLNKGDHPYLNEGLNTTFQPYFDRIAAWFWGHEHNLVIFADNQKFRGDVKALRKGRLLGCSAYEETVGENPYEIKFSDVSYFPDMKELGKSKYKSATQEFYNHAFALFEVTPDKIDVSYYEYPSWDQDYVVVDPPIEPALFTESLLPR